MQAGIGVGRETGGALGADIIDASQQAFLSGLHLAMLVAAGITVLAAIGVFRVAAGPGAGRRPPGGRRSSDADVDAESPVDTVPADAVPAPEGVG